MKQSFLEKILITSLTLNVVAPIIYSKIYSNEWNRFQEYLINNHDKEIFYSGIYLGINAALITGTYILSKKK